MASSQHMKDFGGDFHDPGCTWAKCGKKFSFDKTQISSKVIFFYLPVKMNRMAKIWCTVPRMIFVGGFEQPAVHSTGATAKKHFTRICQNQSFEEKTPILATWVKWCQVTEWHQANSMKDFWWRLS